MKIGSKVIVAFLAGALALPAAGFAAEPAVDATAAVKPKIDAPADCKVTGAKKGNAAMEKRKKAHAQRGTVAGAEKTVVHDQDAAHEHGRHGN